MWKNLNRKKRVLFSIIAGGLMILSFPFTGSLPVLSFVSWVPLLLIENDVFEKGKKASIVFIHSLFVFFLYNIGTTWWIWNSSPLGSILAIGAIASGAYNAGSALLMGGQHLSTTKLLAFSRSQESLAWPERGFLVHKI